MVQPPLFDDRETRTIAQLYRELTGYLDERWGRAHQIWVTGEVQKLSAQRSGHCYLDLIDPKTSGRGAPTLKAKCWRTSWAPIRGALSKEGLSIEEGTVLRARGYVDLYAPNGELGFIVTGIDVEALRLATLGEHARLRAELVRRLTDEGLLEANRAVPVPDVPLRIGLVASKDTEGYNDFVGVLEASGFRFAVTLERSAVQGARAHLDLAAAIARLVRRQVDVVCVVRGGGSQSDLAAFDDERVARAIATCPLPVLTGIGHTGDVSVADLVAHASHRTPTACAEALTGTVREWYAAHVADGARRLDAATASLLDELVDGVGQYRRHVVVVARHRLERAEDRLAHATSSVARRSPHAMSRAGRRVSDRAARLGPLASDRLERAVAALGGRRTLLGAYDPARLLSRGWSITTSPDGTVLRSAHDVEVGSSLATRFADGVARSTVTDVERS